MSELAISFGEQQRLFGILGRPDDERFTARPAVLFLSAGLLHRVGPYRMHVDLARRLNRQGLVTLRFDLGGIADSRAADGSSAENAALLDVGEAMDCVARETGCQQFILCGLCSGAETAHRVAVHDSRVVGLLGLEGHIFPTPAYYLWHYLPRLFSWRKWSLYLQRLLHRGTSALRGGAVAAAGNASLWAGQRLTRDEVAGELQRLCDRGVRQLLVFAGGTGDCSYAAQYRRVFRGVQFRDCIDVRFLPEADHMYIVGRDRDALFQLIDDWISRHFATFPTTVDAASAPAVQRTALPAGRRAALPSRELP